MRTGLRVGVGGDLKVGFDRPRQTLLKQERVGQKFTSPTDEAHGLVRAPNGIGSDGKENG